jgi:hypothetical protein
MNLKQRVRALESGDGSNVHPYPTDARSHDEKLADLRAQHGNGAQFRLPTGNHDELVDLFV